MNKKAMLEKRNDLQEQAEALVNSAKAEERALSEEETTSFDKLEKEMNEIDATLERMEKVEKMEEKKMVNKEEPTVEERESKEFVDYIRGTLENRTADNMTKGDNGAVIPKTVAQKVIAKAYDIAPILKEATKYNTKGEISIPVYDETESAITVAYADEFADLEGHIGKFTSVTLTGFLAGALALISKSLVNNTDIDLEATVVNLMGEALARFMTKEILLGTAHKVSGLKTDITANIAAASSTALALDDLIKCKNKVPKAFRKNGKWVMNQDTLTALELLKDQDGRYIFHEDPTGEWDGILLGYPVDVDENMPNVGKNAVPVYFGDYSGIALKQRDDALEVEVLREPYATKHAVGVVAWAEFDAKLENKQKMAKITCPGA